MIRRILSIIGFVAVAYVVVFIPVGGNMTLWQHFRRIWATDEAQHMSRDVGGAIDDLGDDLRDRLNEPPIRDGGVDLGPSPEEAVAPDPSVTAE